MAIPYGLWQVSVLQTCHAIITKICSIGTPTSMFVNVCLGPLHPRIQYVTIMWWPTFLEWRGDNLTTTTTAITSFIAHWFRLIILYYLWSCTHDVMMSVSTLIKIILEVIVPHVGKMELRHTNIPLNHPT